MNKPIVDLIERTDWLKQQVDQITAGRNLLALHDNIDASVAVGDAVYLQTSTGTVKPALAKFATSYASDGSLRLNESGYVLGLVVSKPNATSAYVFTTGTYEDQSLADVIFGVSADPGVYRLSMTNDGKLTATEQEIDILVAVYQGNGRFTLFDKRASIPNHIHQTYVLDQAWLLESDIAFDEMEKPVGATHGYDIVNDANLSRIFATVPGSVRVFGDGVLIAETEIVGNLDNLWGLSGDPSGTYTVLEAVAVLPYTFGEPVLRGATSDTPDEIELSAQQGILKANMAAWQFSAGTPDGTALKTLSGRAAETVPVVTGINVVAPLDKGVSAQGIVTLSWAGGINTFLEPEIVNLNNSIEATDGLYVYYALPAGRDASLIGRISLPYFEGTLKAAIVAEVQGLAGGGAIPQLAANYIVHPYPSTEQALAGAVTGPILLPADVISANSVKIVEVDSLSRFDVTARGTVYLHLGYDTPAEDIKITRFGLILYTS